jgi:hypothetical protein
LFSRCCGGTGDDLFSRKPPALTVQEDPALAYVATTVEYRVSSQGVKTAISERTRYVKANGEWRLVRNNPDGQPARNKEHGAVASTQEGVFAKAPGNAEKKWLSGAAPEQMQKCFRSVACLRAQPGFIRTDQIAGLEVYVLREPTNNPAHPVEWSEKSYSPKTGYIPLRNIQHFRDGSELVIEAVKIEFRDVADNLNEDIEARPVRKR